MIPPQVREPSELTDNATFLAALLQRYRKATAPRPRASGGLSGRVSRQRTRRTCVSARDAGSGNRCSRPGPSPRGQSTLPHCRSSWHRRANSPAAPSLGAAIIEAKLGQSMVRRGRWRRHRHSALTGTRANALALACGPLGCRSVKGRGYRYYSWLRSSISRSLHESDVGSTRQELRSSRNPTSGYPAIATAICKSFETTRLLANTLAPPAHTRHLAQWFTHESSAS